jgi:hypothetical protein
LGPCHLKLVQHRTAATDKFQALDTVFLDDSGTSTNLLLLSTALYPGQVTVNSSTRNYLLGGSGGLAGRLHCEEWDQHPRHQQRQ